MIAPRETATVKRQAIIKTARCRLIPMPAAEKAVQSCDGSSEHKTSQKTRTGATFSSELLQRSLCFTPTADDPA
jgi:hypothetical protein